jgi:hypothetical protein
VARARRLRAGLVGRLGTGRLRAFRHSAESSATVQRALQQCRELCNSAESSATVQRALQQYRELCNSAESSATVQSSAAAGSLRPAPPLLRPAQPPLPPSPPTRALTHRFPEVLLALTPHPPDVISLLPCTRPAVRGRAAALPRRGALRVQGPRLGPSRSLLDKGGAGRASAAADGFRSSSRCPRTRRRRSCRSTRSRTS